MGAGCSNEAATATATPAEQPDRSDAGGPADKEARRTARTKLMGKCFAALDLDGSGMIEINEWKKYLVGGGVSKAVVDEQAAKLVASMDVNADNKISREEFVTALERLTGSMPDDEFAALLAGVVNKCREAAVAAGGSGSRIAFGDKLSVVLLLQSLAAETRVAKLRLCFQAMDADNSGFIEPKEFKAYVSQTRDSDAEVAAEAQALIIRMDANGDQKVSMEEFMCALAEFKNTCSDVAFSKLVEGVFLAASGQIIASNVLKNALT